MSRTCRSQSLDALCAESRSTSLTWTTRAGGARNLPCWRGDPDRRGELWRAWRQQRVANGMPWRTSAQPPAGYDPLAQPSVYSPTSDPVVDAYPKVLKPPTMTVPELKRAGVGTTATRHPGEWDQARPKDPFTYQLQVGTVAIPGERPSTSRPQGPAPSLDLPRRAVSPRSALLPLVHDRRRPPRRFCCRVSLRLPPKRCALCAPTGPSPRFVPMPPSRGVSGPWGAD